MNTDSYFSKIKELRKRYPDLNIGVDGGLNADNFEEAAVAGANVIVSGVYLCQHPDPKSAIQFMKDSVTKIHGGFQTSS